ncbi:MAG: iron-sulfur cluster assembly scaffold protein [Dehalococcoidia bacterium]|jgi:nitrogen fixation NifU-like protein
MASSWDKFEELVREKMLEVYSEAAVDHAMNPRNMGDMAEADGSAKVTGPCGDTMQLWLKLKGDTIENATFLTSGCGTSIASGSMVTELAKGKKLGQAQKIGQQDVLDALGGLPEESEHCALLAADTLKAAIQDHLAMKKEPWKKAYREH